MGRTWMWLWLGWTALALARPQPKTVTTFVREVRLHRQLQAQGKKTGERISVTLEGEWFSPPLILPDIRKGTSQRPEIEFLRRYQLELLQGSATQILRFWAPAERPAKAKVLREPKMLRLVRQQARKDLRVLGVLQQAQGVTVVCGEPPHATLHHMVHSSQGFWLTDHPHKELDLAILEAGLNRPAKP